MARWQPTVNDDISHHLLFASMLRYVPRVPPPSYYLLTLEPGATSRRHGNQMKNGDSMLSFLVVFLSRRTTTVREYEGKEGQQRWHASTTPRIDDTTQRRHGELTTWRNNAKMVRDNEAKTARDNEGDADTPPTTATPGHLI
jgi:hypothetical protein